MSGDRTSAERFVDSVFFPSDFSEASENAFAHALAIALMRQTELVLLHVGQGGDVDSDWARFPAVRRTLERWGVLEPGSPRSAVFEQLRVRIRKVRLSGRDPANTIAEYLADKHPDLIVLATEGRDGLPRWLETSVAEKVARQARSMTLFVPSGTRGIVDFETGQTRLRRILVPIDHQPSPEPALEYAHRAAEALGEPPVEICTLHIGENPPYLTLPSSERTHWSHQTRTGDPLTVIGEVVSEQKPDLVVMTTEGRRGILEAFQGSTTERILRSLPCPLMSVPARQ